MRSLWTAAMNRPCHVREWTMSGNTVGHAFPLFLLLIKADGLLGIGVGTPLTKPKPYEYVVNTSLNFRF